MSMVIRFPGGKRVDAEYGGFVIHTDQAEHHGGEGSAPTPFDLFLSSIGTCAGFYCLNFLEKRGCSTADTTVELEVLKDPETHMVSAIKITAKVSPDFPEKYRDALIRSMDLCSVKKHILNAPAFDVSVETTG